jgi:DNA-binding IclR family transcriptional regulator
MSKTQSGQGITSPCDADAIRRCETNTTHKSRPALHREQRRARQLGVVEDTVEGRMLSSCAAIAEPPRETRPVMRNNYSIEM